jgi:hypothetical protein
MGFQANDFVNPSWFCWTFENNFLHHRLFLLLLHVCKLFLLNKVIKIAKGYATVLFFHASIVDECMHHPWHWDWTLVCCYCFAKDIVLQVGFCESIIIIMLLDILNFWKYYVNCLFYLVFAVWFWSGYSPFFYIEMFDFWLHGHVHIWTFWYLFLALDFVLSGGLIKKVLNLYMHKEPSTSGWQKTSFILCCTICFLKWRSINLTWFFYKGSFKWWGVVAIETKNNWN